MKNTIKTIFVLFLISCVILTLLTGCGEQEADDSTIVIEESATQKPSSVDIDSSTAIEESSLSQSDSEENVSDEPVVEDYVFNPYMNPLTGEIADYPIAYTRPVVSTIDNHPDAVPPVGVSHASIIYEGIVEGGATRMFAVFQELPDDLVIGGVRSLRHNFIDFAACYDAIIIHCGGSDIALNALEDRGYDDIDAISGAGGLFYRDPWRDDNLGYVHSMVTTGKAIKDYLADDGPYRTEHESDYRCNMRFSDNPIVNGGELKTDIDVFFGEYKHTNFTFDASTNEYTAEEFGSPYIDYATGTPVNFKNLVIIRTDVWECDGVGHKDMTLTGSGEGYFCVNGVTAPIIWTREDQDSQFVFTYKDGTPITFGVGKTYIAVVDLEGGIS